MASLPLCPEDMTSIMATNHLHVKYSEAGDAVGLWENLGTRLEHLHVHLVLPWVKG